MKIIIFNLLEKSIISLTALYLIVNISSAFVPYIYFLNYLILNLGSHFHHFILPTMIKFTKNCFQKGKDTGIVSYLHLSRGGNGLKKFYCHFIFSHFGSYFMSNHRLVLVKYWLNLVKLPFFLRKVLM